MALFKRADLKTQGFTDEQIEYIMTESGRSLSANYVLSSDVQSRIDEAVAAVKPEQIDVKTTPEYAEEISADGYSKDAAEAVKVAKRLLGMLNS